MKISDETAKNHQSIQEKDEEKLEISKEETKMEKIKSEKEIIEIQNPDTHRPKSAAQPEDHIMKSDLGNDGGIESPTMQGYDQNTHQDPVLENNEYSEEESRYLSFY